MSSGSMEQTSIPSPQADPDDDVDVIGYERIQLASKDDIHTVAETVLNSALKSADYGETGEKIIYGNPAGREILEGRHDLKGRMKRLEDRQEKMDAQLQRSDAKITDLQHRVKALTLASEGYLEIRHRFIEVYRRDVLDDVDRQGRKKIGEGNEAAHHGDAVTDASLYTSGERFDEMVLTELYGLTASQISSLARAGDFDSISTLNAGATWKANDPSNIPLNVDTAFKTFVEELRKNHGKSLTDGTGSLSKAYYAFWTAHNAHK